MYQTLCIFYRDPNGPSKEKDAYNPSNEGIREKNWSEIIPYHYNLKGQQTSIQKISKLAFKEADD